MQIEKATVGDIPDLCDLLDILFSQEVEFKPERTVQETGLRAIIEDPKTGTILVARRERRTIGMVNLLFTVSTALGGRVAILEDLVVMPGERGSGVGSKLINSAINKARECGCRRITLLTDHSNETAHRFYKKYGFASSEMVPFRLALS
ncbi:MAG: GNAT family N-acetyltransferase [Desulfobulbaceae bacterium]|nr:GNAT family N-acetyltransferase [Desulfobulbaceae bacterium]